eukprot:c8806_g2_i2.p1 GENE.c8806_g2_i2~~c8806_g2_i2.p1  ORF type:complete len:516 (+),score=121.95 c8806_g2_i2:128-1675(+)
MYKLSFDYIILHANKQNGFKSTTAKCHETLSIEFAKSCLRARNEWMTTRNQLWNFWLTTNEQSLWACLAFACDHLPKHLQLPDRNPEYVASLGILAANFAEMLRMRERRRDAHKVIKHGLEICEQSGNFQGEARCRLSASKNLAESREITRSREEMLRALGLFHHVNDQQGYVETLEVIVQVRFSTARPKYYAVENLIDVYVKLGEKTATQFQGKQSPFVLDSPVVADLSLTDEQLIERALPLAKSDKWLEADFHLLKGQLISRNVSLGLPAAELQQAFSPVFAIYDVAMELYQSIDNEFGMAEVFRLKAHLEWKKKDAPGALQCLNECLKLYEKNQFITPLANVTRLIGEIKFGEAQRLFKDSQYFFSQERANSAEKDFQHARKLFETCGRRYGAGVTLRLLGELYDWVATHDPPLKVSDLKEYTKTAAIECLENAVRTLHDEENLPQGTRMRLKTCIKLISILCRKPSADKKAAAYSWYEQARKICDENLASEDQPSFSKDLDFFLVQLQQFG